MKVKIVTFIDTDGVSKDFKCQSSMLSYATMYCKSGKVFLNGEYTYEVINTPQTEIKENHHAS